MMEKDERICPEKIIVVNKTHLDLGFTNLPDMVTKLYLETYIPDAVKLGKQTRSFPRNEQYRWTLPAWLLYKASGTEKKDSDLWRTLFWHALPFTTFTSFCGVEDYCRSFDYSDTLARRAGHTVLSAKMTDVPGHSWMLPEILYQNNIRFLHLGCNPCTMPPDVPRLFYWEAPSGHRVLVFYSVDYGTKTMPPPDWKYPVWLVMHMTNDNQGSLDLNQYRSLLERIKTESPGSEIICGTLDDFYKELLPFLGDEVPVIRKELGDVWSLCTSGFPKEVASLRQVRRFLRSAECFLNFSGLGDPVFDDLIRDSYEQLILFGEHSWGGDYKSILKQPIAYESKEVFLHSLERPDMKLLNASWEAKRTYEKHASDLCGKIKLRLKEKLGNGEDLFIFNASTFSRSATVAADAGCYYDSAAGKPVPSVRLPDGKWELYVEDVPACGWKFLSHGIEKQEDILNFSNSCALENQWFKLNFDPERGTLSSLYDKRTEKEWVPQDGIGEYRYDVFDNDDITEFLRPFARRFAWWWVDDFGRRGYPEEIRHYTETPSGFSVRKIREDAFASAVELKCVRSGNDSRGVRDYGDVHTIILTVQLSNLAPVIDMSLQIKGDQMTPMIESGSFRIPLAMKNPKCRVHTMGCVEDVEQDIVRRANHTVYTLEDWIDLEDSGSGILLISKDAHLVSLGENGIYKYREKPIPRKSELWFNLFHTKHPKWMTKDFSCRFRLIPHPAKIPVRELMRMAEEYRNPFAAYPCKGNHGLAAEKSFFPENDKLRILSVRKKENDLIFRVQDVSGSKHVFFFPENEKREILPYEILTFSVKPTGQI